MAEITFDPKLHPDMEGFISVSDPEMCIRDRSVPMAWWRMWVLASAMLAASMKAWMAISGFSGMRPSKPTTCLLYTSRCV